MFLLLVAVTVAASVFAEVDGPRARGMTVLLVALAVLKIHLVGMHFMELRRAPVALVLLFHAWLVGVGVVLVAMS